MMSGSPEYAYRYVENGRNKSDWRSRAHDIRFVLITQDVSDGGHEMAGPFTGTLRRYTGSRSGDERRNESGVGAGRGKMKQGDDNEVHDNMITGGSPNSKPPYRQELGSHAEKWAYVTRRQ